MVSLLLGFIAFILAYQEEKNDNSSMLRLKKASINDLPLIMKLFRRVKMSLEAEGLTFYSGDYPNETDFRDDIEKGTLYIGKQNGMIVAMASVSFSIIDEFYAKSHDEAKVLSLLALTGAKDGEDALIIHRLMVDPIYQRHGLGKEMLQYLESLYPHRLYLLITYKDNTPAVPFYLHNGFTYAGDITPEYGIVPPMSFPLFFKR